MTASRGRRFAALPRAHIPEKMAPTLKLQYFDFDFWRAEGCRLTMHVGGLVRLPP